MTNATDAQRSALRWIIGKIEKHGLPYQVVGGLAAMAHGGTRPLHDIDLYLPLQSNAGDFLADIQPYVSWGPAAVVEGPWDITYLKLNYGGQKIEIGDSTEPKIKDASSGDWITKIIDFDTSVVRQVLGCNVNVMPLDQLMAYKTILAREVDLQDIQELELISASGKPSL